MKKLIPLALLLVFCFSISAQTKTYPQGGTPNYTVATLPASNGVGALVTVTDGSSASDCTVGGGSAKVLCMWNGFAYTATSSSPTAGSLPAGIDAAKIADGSVSNAEFQRVDFTSSGQGQLDAKQAALSVSNKLGLAAGGTNADLSATGGTSQVVKQTSSGGALTVARLACADLSDSGAGCAGSGGITNSAGADVVPKSNGTNLVASQIQAFSTEVSFGGNFRVGTVGDGTDTWFIGDAEGDNSAVVQGNIGAGTLLFSAGVSFTFNAPIIAQGGIYIGPLGSNQSSQITGTFTGNRVATLPDATGTVLLDTLFNLSKTITAGGTTGTQTINKHSGSVNFAAAATSLVVTNSLVATTSIVQCTVATNDATMKSVQCVPASGSFTMFSNAAASAETRVNFTVSN